MGMVRAAPEAVQSRYFAHSGERLGLCASEVAGKWPETVPRPIPVDGHHARMEEATSAD